MSRKERLKGIFDQAAEEVVGADLPEEPARGHAGPVRTMALTLGRMEEEQQALKQAIQAGLHVVDLDPGLVDPSFVRDRLATDTSADDADLVRSIDENGQEVPILVRDNPNHPGRYQVAYGHRRLQAALVLNRPVKAIIRPMQDTDVVIAQGVENAARQNLSYIERAMFAFTLEERGFKRAVIMRALSTDKTELSKLITVARQIPRETIHAIGPAPSIGRRRWMQLAALIDADESDAVAQLVTRAEFLALPSDSRFDAVIAALTAPAYKAPDATIWTPETESSLSATIKRGEHSFSIALKAAEAPGFGAFIADKLDELYRAFKRNNPGD